ncbi:MAG TPA: MATE family efflux transporter [Candidatus Polarisedimenticolaceae bacterium]|nr:MATE family efflux transporter [Candidatus Polarisedimenticolaceae bacterium]
MNLRDEIRPMLRLSVPVVTVQLGLMAMGVVDTMMVGRVSPVALAAVALGNLYFFNALIFPFGVLTALDPLFSQAVGAGDRTAVARDLRRGMALAAVLTLPFSLLQWPAGAVLAFLGQAPEVVPVAAAYVRASIPGVFPFLAFLVLRQALQALSRIGPVVAAIVGANVLNVVLNLVLIYGAGPVPALGAVGSAWASTVSRWAMVAGLLLAGGGELRRLVFAGVRGAVTVPLLVRTLRLGSPIGAQYLLEIGAFAIVGLLMGHLGVVEVAAHQVTLNLASLTFMVPLGVATAAAVRVGHAVGAGDPSAARRAAAAALVLGAGFMALCGAAFLVFPGALVRWYSADAAVVALAMLLVPIAGVFQVFDGLQVVAAGILRGLGHMRTAMVVNVVGFWTFGVPVSLFLAFRAGLGPVGLWWGLVAGLCGVAVVLLWRVRAGLRGTLRRLTVDDAAPLDSRG